ncbi:PE-PPE domain-containing protein [Candidatus Saccharibacteria bacterium]|nr:PE-PPE domain-containing protein [Candidatus Saccharibacteria bacterium]
MARFNAAENISNGDRKVGIVKRGLVCGLGATAAASLMLGVGAGAASADRCFVIGGMGDGSGEGARGIMADQGRLASCNEGVETVQYSASIFPVGPETMNQSVAPAVVDLTDRLNNTPAWQHKRVLAFSEGTVVAAQAINQTNGTNIKAELYGGPQGRTGAFHSPLVTDIPLVKPIINMIGIPTDTPLNVRPGVQYERVYREDDGDANLGAQGHDVFSALPGAIGIADGMLNRGGHQIPDPNSPRVEFYDADGVRNWAHDDFDPRTANGANNPEVVALPPAPAPVVERLPAPSFWGEAACVAEDGSPYWTPGDAPC